MTISFRPAITSYKPATLQFGARPDQIPQLRVFLAEALRGENAQRIIDISTADGNTLKRLNLDPHGHKIQNLRREAERIIDIVKQNGHEAVGLMLDSKEGKALLEAVEERVREVGADNVDQFSTEYRVLLASGDRKRITSAAALTPNEQRIQARDSKRAADDTFIHLRSSGPVGWCC